MKNNFINIIIFFITFLSLLTHTHADEFIFNVTEMQVSEKGNLVKGIGGGTVTTKNNIVITADNFEYNKLTTLLKAVGNAKLVDRNQNITIEAPEVYYLKNKEEIYTLGKSKANEGLYIEINADDYFRYNKLTSILEAKGNTVITDIEKDVIIESNQIFYEKIKNKFFTIGKTRAYVEKKYTINTSNLVFLKGKMLISSIKKTILNDDLSNFYKLEEFEYQVDKEILKGKGVEVTTASNTKESDKYFFETGFFDFKKNKFLAQDIEVIFHKEMYDEIENDPRLKGVTGTGNKFYTYLNNAVFTTCKKTDKCPPWVMASKKVMHDKIKKQIIYKDAFLKIYDIPVVYFPKFFHPDPTVKRQSGLLAPSYSNSSTLGSYFSIPYFHVLSDTKDITLKPRIYDSDRYVLQGEYKQKTKKTLSIADFSFTKGHNSSQLDQGDNRTHLFTKTIMNLDFDKFLRSELEIQYQKVSNDTYLKIFNFESPLFKSNIGTLESSINLDLESSNYNFDLSIKRYETLSGLNSDRYQYVLPSYYFSKELFKENLSGNFNFNSYGNNTLSKTNIHSTSLSNDLNYRSYDDYFDNGIKDNFEIFIRNLNTVGKNNIKYKTSPQSELISSYMYSMSLPLIKNSSKYKDYLEPKFSIKFSPHDMKNHQNVSRGLNIDNIYNIDRLSLGDSFEGGESLTFGINYKKDKFIYRKNIKEVEDYLDFKIATVIRNSDEKNIPTSSTIGKKNSNIFGGFKYTLLNEKAAIDSPESEYFSLNYKFSTKKDLSIFEYNSLDAKINFNNLSTQFLFEERQGVVGASNVLENKTKYTFDKNNSLEFQTRRNKEINLTEYYNLIYEYKNDCLTAGIRYKKKYYRDNDIVPTEELFFSITIIPFATFSPDELALNKDRVD